MRVLHVLLIALAFSAAVYGQATSSKPAAASSPDKAKLVKRDTSAQASSTAADMHLQRDAKSAQSSNSSEASYLSNLAIATGLATIIGGMSAFVGIWYYRGQARAATRDHMNSVHHSVFERLDKTDVREARHYVYSMDTTVNFEGEPEEREPSDIDSLAYSTENWLLLGTRNCPGTKDDQIVWAGNKKKAEIIARALDQLGYLVREGIVPLNVVARFYSYPTLRCWYQLSPYIAAVRIAREQNGHMWEWENLVKKILKGAGENKGLWDGAGEHDNLNRYAKRIVHRAVEIGRRVKGQRFPRDERWNPPDRSWEWKPDFGLRRQFASIFGGSKPVPYPVADLQPSPPAIASSPRPPSPSDLSK